MKNILFVFAATVCAVTVHAEVVEKSSNAVFVFLRPETSSFWNTATNSTILLPVEFPKGVAGATLEVAGVEYSKTYSISGSGDFELTLPPAVSERTENVYSLTLSFDDGTVRTAKLGLIEGLSSEAEGTTRCITSAGNASWSKVKYRAVLPVPHGMTSVKVALNGEEPADMDTGLGGAQGWFAVGSIARGDNVSVSGTADGISYDAFLRGWGEGLFFHIR